MLSAGKRIVFVATGQEADRSFTSGLINFVEHHQNGDYLRKLSWDVSRGILAVGEARALAWRADPLWLRPIIPRPKLDTAAAVQLMNDGSQQVIDVATRSADGTSTSISIEDVAYHWPASTTCQHCGQSIDLRVIGRRFEPWPHGLGQVYVMPPCREVPEEGGQP